VSRAYLRSYSNTDLPTIQFRFAMPYSASRVGAMS
jgi:hypothetical protein